MLWPGWSAGTLSNTAWLPSAGMLIKASKASDALPPAFVTLYDTRIESTTGNPVAGCVRDPDAITTSLTATSATGGTQDAVGPHSPDSSEHAVTAASSINAARARIEYEAARITGLPC